MRRKTQPEVKAYTGLYVSDAGMVECQLVMEANGTIIFRRRSASHHWFFWREYQGEPLHDMKPINLEEIPRRRVAIA